MVLRTSPFPNRQDHIAFLLLFFLAVIFYSTENAHISYLFLNNRIFFHAIDYIRFLLAASVTISHY